jgi:hypothetical protein
MAIFAAEAKAQGSGESLPNLEAPVEPLRPEVTESLVLTELAAHNEQRRSALHNYNVLRTYRVVDLKGNVHAEEAGRDGISGAGTKRRSRSLPSLAQDWSEIWR